MRRLLPHIRLANRVIISNVWLLESASEKFLVDTGHPLERLSLYLSLRAAGVREPGDLTAVILTHRHSDHAGNAAWLREKFKCPVVCHEDDAPALSGKVKPPNLSRRKVAWIHEELLCRFEDRWPAVCPVDETFVEGEWRWGFSVAHVPGHTEGSSMLHHEPTGTLFAGDAILAGIPPLRFLGEWIRLAVPGFSLDVERCRDHVRAFLEVLPPTETVCSGHGPLVRDAGSKLKKFLEKVRR